MHILSRDPSRQLFSPIIHCYKRKLKLQRLGTELGLVITVNVRLVEEARFKV